MAKVSGSWQRVARRYGPQLASLECISRHRGRCTDKWQEHVRAGNCSVQRRGSKIRSSLRAYVGRRSGLLDVADRLTVTSR